jgi:heme A synthase
MVFTKTITSKSGEQDSSSNGMAGSMMEMMFGKYKWTYEITLPGKIISSNAAQNEIDNSTNTVKWAISMASLAKPQILTVTFQKQATGNMTLIILAVLVVIVLALVFFFRIKKKNAPTV